MTARELGQELGELWQRALDLGYLALYSCHQALDSPPSPMVFAGLRRAHSFLLGIWRSSKERRYLGTRTVIDCSPT